MVASLAVLGKPDAVRVGKKVMDFVLSCMNFDNGLGSGLGPESHAGQICCCPGFLVIISQL